MKQHPCFYVTFKLPSKTSQSIPQYLHWSWWLSYSTCIFKKMGTTGMNSFFDWIIWYWSRFRLGHTFAYTWTPCLQLSIKPCPDRHMGFSSQHTKPFVSEGCAKQGWLQNSLSKYPAVSCINQFLSVFWRSLTSPWHYRKRSGQINYGLNQDCKADPKPCMCEWEAIS